MTNFVFETEDVCCSACGSSNIHINMFYQVWSGEWHGDNPEVWCHDCYTDTTWLRKDEYEPEEEDDDDE